MGISVRETWRRRPKYWARDLASLSCWVDFPDISGSDGDAISSVSDKSGAGENFTQVTGNKQPLLKLAIQNGRSVLRFDGSNDYLLGNLSSVFSGTDLPCTILCVSKARVTPSSGNYMTVCGPGYSIFSSNSFHMGVDNDGSAQYFVDRRDSVSTEKTLYAGTLDNNFHVIIMKFTGLTGSLFVDGTQIGVDTDMDVGAVTFDQFAIGALVRNNVINCLDGDVGEMIVFNVAVSSRIINLLHRYGRWKWRTW